mgnify:CR=1 FL=1
MYMSTLPPVSLASSRFPIYFSKTTLALSKWMVLLPTDTSLLLLPWERLCAMGATTMAVPESAGGDGATLVDLTLVAEEIGRSLAPVPWIDHVCAERLLARLGAVEADVVDGTKLVALDPQQDAATGRRLRRRGRQAPGDSHPARRAPGAARGRRLRRAFARALSRPFSGGH